MLFVLVNEGTARSPITASVTVDWLKQCAAACAVQLNRDVSAEWGGSYSVRVAENPKDIAPGEIAFSLVDALPDAPGDIAYHDRDGKAVPFALLALSTCSTLGDVSVGISHELCETAGDPECNTWADTGGGLEVAQELCDAVEAYSYAIGAIALSDFVLRAFFAPGAPGPYHYMASIGAADLAGPFLTASGGYQIQRSGAGTTTQITGNVRAARRAKVAHFSSRPQRRGLRSFAG